MSVASTLLKIVPPSTAGWIRYVRGRHQDFYPYGFAMNGQTARLEVTRQIIHRCGIQQIVETGTFRGTTTEWFSGFGLPVNTVETDPSTYEFARRRLARLPNVHIELGNSVEVLHRLASELNTALPTLFYLDAHWWNYLPLHDELELILQAFSAPAVLVDDFQVPGEEGYGYDDYGPDKALTPEYLRTCKTDATIVFYPSTPAREETGCRRGCVVLTSNPDLASRMSEMSLLKLAN